MSQENVEIVRRFWDLALRADLRHGDWPHLDLLSEDVIYRPVSQMAEARECRGRQEFRRLMEDFFVAGWSEDLAYEPTSFREYGDRVMVRVQFAGHGRASGAEFSGRAFAVFTLREGEIVQVEDFIERSDALEAVGLSE